jgi:hypothetical protein
MPLGEASTWCAGGFVRDHVIDEVRSAAGGRGVTVRDDGFISREDLAKLKLSFNQLMGLFVPVHVTDMGTSRKDRPVL